MSLGDNMENADAGFLDEENGDGSLIKPESN
jgi:hypothetical protein